MAEDGSASLITVTEEDIRRANKTNDEDWFNSTVPLGEVNGGGYMASLELFHQMHCVVCPLTHLMRQSTNVFHRILFAWPCTRTITPSLHRCQTALILSI